MKGRLVLAMLLATVPSAIHAQQRAILMGETQEGAKLFVLPDTADRSDPAVTVWTREELPTVTGTRVYGTRAIYDCAARSMTILRRQERDASGRRISESIVPPDELSTFTPRQGSPEQRSLSLICAAFLGR
jgi:hypothetical protein